MQPTNQQWGTAPPAPDFNLKPYIGNLALIVVAGYHPGVTTIHGTRPAVRLAFIPLDGPGAGEPIVNVLVFNTRIVRRLSAMPGSTVLHRIQMEATKGNDAYELGDPSQADAQLANSWISAYPTKLGELHAQLKPIHDAEEQRLRREAEGQPQQQTNNGNHQQGLRDVQDRWAQPAQQQQGPPQPPPWGQGQPQTQASAQPQWGQQPQGFQPPPPPPPPPPVQQPAWSGAPPAQDTPPY